MNQNPTNSGTEVLIQTWPLTVRLFCLLWGTLALVISPLASGGHVIVTTVICLIGVLVGSLFFLENHILFDAGAHEVRVCFRWLWWRQNRCISQASIKHVYLRRVGKGSDLGALLDDGSRVSFLQPSGYESDKEALAQEVAHRIGVGVVVVPLH